MTVTSSGEKSGPAGEVQGPFLFLCFTKEQFSLFFLPTKQKPNPRTGRVSVFLCVHVLGQAQALEYMRIRVCEGQ